MKIYKILKQKINIKELKKERIECLSNVFYQGGLIKKPIKTNIGRNVNDECVAVLYDEYLIVSEAKLKKKFDKDVIIIKYSKVFDTSFLNIKGIRRIIAEYTEYILSYNFIENNIKKFNKSGLSSNPLITVDFFEKHLDKISWKDLSRNPNIPFWFFDKHIDKISWPGVSSNPNITIDFINKHKKKIHWGAIANNANFNVIKHFKDKFFVANNKNVPVEFIIDQYSRPVFNRVSISEDSRIYRNPNWSIELAEKYNTSIDYRQKYVTLDYIKKNYDRIIRESKSNRLNDPIFIWLNPNLDEKFLEEHINDIDWYDLSSNEYIPISFFDKHFNRVHVNSLISNKSLTEEFIEKHPSLLNDHLFWQYIIINPNISFKFLLKHGLLKNKSYLGFGGNVNAVKESNVENIMKVLENVNK